MEHDALRLLGRYGEPIPWVLTPRRVALAGHAAGRATANSPEMLTQLARAGAGIAAAADHFAEPHVARGELVPVLPDWNLPPSPAWAVFPGRRLMPARTRVFLDALAAEFVGPRCTAQLEKSARMRAAAASR